MKIRENYEFAKERYAKIGVDTDAALEKLSRLAVSMQCWQADDIKGFMFADQEVSGGIQVTGNYPGAARNPDELRADLDMALSLIPGKHKVNLHSIYAEAPAGTELNEIEPAHFSAWVDWAKERGIGLDFNPTCFGHPMAASGFTLSSAQDDIREFWIEHCKRSRKIGEHFGKVLGKKAVTNIWLPDGMKDTPADRMAPRVRLKEALDAVFSEALDRDAHTDAVESKLFGIGSESYVVGSNEFYMGYAVANRVAVTLDSGHFHPTERISDKISNILLFAPELALHISRPVRWDSDHVVTFDDELIQITHELVYADAWDRVHMGLDYFDASINRIAALTIGMRNTVKGLLMALLEPMEELKTADFEGDYTKRLIIQEELKTMPFQAVWDYYCEISGVPISFAWAEEVKKYEKDVLAKRGYAQ